MKQEVVFRDQFETRKKMVITDRDMSKHILLLGEHGSGKTNTFGLLMSQISDEKLVVFDPKGDYLNEFGKKGDIVTGNAASIRRFAKYWNIFREIESSSPYLEGKRLTIKELANSFFAERKNGMQPFFSDAAKDLFSMILENQMRILWDDPDYLFIQRKIDTSDSTEEIKNLLGEQEILFNKLVNSKLNNRALSGILNNGSLETYRTLLSEKFPRVFGYLGTDGVSNGALSVVGELQAMYFDIFKYTAFEEYIPGRDFSISSFINQSEARRLFIEYDIATASALGPVYRSLFDIALKTQMNNFHLNHTVTYFILDELKLVPKMVQLENGLNFGRGLGVRLIAGLQNIDQIREAYSEHEAQVILDGFGSMWCFSLSGSKTSREYVLKRFEQRSRYRQRPEAWEFVQLSDEHFIKLRCGQAICKTVDHLYPFLFDFEEYVFRERTDLNKRMIDIGEDFQYFYYKNTMV